MPRSDYELGKFNQVMELNQLVQSESFDQDRNITSFKIYYDQAIYLD